MPAAPLLPAMPPASDYPAVLARMQAAAAPALTPTEVRETLDECVTAGLLASWSPAAPTGDGPGGFSGFACHAATREADGSLRTDARRTGWSAAGAELDLLRRVPRLDDYAGFPAL